MRQNYNVMIRYFLFQVGCQTTFHFHCYLRMSDRKFFQNFLFFFFAIRLCISGNVLNEMFSLPNYSYSFFCFSQNRRKLFTVLLDVLSDHLATNNAFFIFFHKPNRFLSNQFLFVSSFSWCCLCNTYLKLYLLARAFYIRITFSN